MDPPGAVSCAAGRAAETVAQSTRRRKEARLDERLARIEQSIAKLTNIMQSVFVLRNGMSLSRPPPGLAEEAGDEVSHLEDEDFKDVKIPQVENSFEQKSGEMQVQQVQKDLGGIEIALETNEQEFKGAAQAPCTAPAHGMQNVEQSMEGESTSAKSYGYEEEVWNGPGRWRKTELDDSPESAPQEAQERQDEVLRDLIRRIYEEHQPGQLPELPGLFLTYTNLPGGLRTMLSKVQNKYVRAEPAEATLSRSS